MSTHKLAADVFDTACVCSVFPCPKDINIYMFKGVRLDRVRGGRQKYKRRPEVENATYQSAPLQLTKETEKGGICTPLSSFRFLVIPSLRGVMAKQN